MGDFNYGAFYCAAACSTLSGHEVFCRSGRAHADEGLVTVLA